jgi:cation diffusion facilitator CzcD-associated flavoprotein CzcO
LLRQKLTLDRLTRMGLISKDGVDIKDIWSDEIASYLGMMIHGFPNAFMIYSPQGMYFFPSAALQHYNLTDTLSSANSILEWPHNPRMPGRFHR